MTLNKVSDLGLRVLYQKDEKFSSEVRMIMGIVFVPPTAVLRSWEELEAYLIANQSKAMGVFRHWDVLYVRGWVDGNTLEDHGPVWNMYNRTLTKKSRTTNSVESWHRRLNTLIKKHPRFEDFVDALKKEWVFIETNIQLVKSGQLHKVKKTMSKYEIEREERIYNVVSNCGLGYRNAIEYLKAIADATKKVGH